MKNIRKNKKYQVSFKIFMGLFLFMLLFWIQSFFSFSDLGKSAKDFFISKAEAGVYDSFCWYEPYWDPEPTGGDG